MSKTAGLNTFFELEVMEIVDGGWFWLPPKGGNVGVAWSLPPPGPPPEVVEASEAMEAHGLAGGVVAEAKTKAVLVLVWFWSAGACC